MHVKYSCMRFSLFRAVRCHWRKLTLQLICCKKGSKTILQRHNRTPKPARDTGHHKSAEERGLRERVIHKIAGCFGIQNPKWVMGFLLAVGPKLITHPRSRESMISLSWYSYCDCSSWKLFGKLHQELICSAGQDWAKGRNEWDIISCTKDLKVYDRTGGTVATGLHEKAQRPARYRILSSKEWLQWTFCCKHHWLGIAAFQHCRANTRKKKSCIGNTPPDILHDESNPALWGIVVPTCPRLSWHVLVDGWVQLGQVLLPWDWEWQVLECLHCCRNLEISKRKRSGFPEHVMPLGPDLHHLLSLPEFCLGWKPELAVRATHSA